MAEMTVEGRDDSLLRLYCPCYLWLKELNSETFYRAFRFGTNLEMVLRMRSRSDALWPHVYVLVCLSLICAL